MLTDCLERPSCITSPPNPVPTPTFIRFRPTRLLVAVLICGCVFVAAGAGSIPSAVAAEPAFGVGATFDTLQAGSKTYRHVQVRSVNARTITITYAGGMASVHLRDLSPELRAAFGYDPRADATAEAALDAAERRTEQKERTEAAAAPSLVPAVGSSGSSEFDRLLLSFTHPPTIRPGVDLRPRFFALGLNVKNQGPRPSCAVFAIVSVLEFENARLTGRPERFSEEYLIWATCKTLDRVSRDPNDATTGNGQPGEPADPVDEGFSLSEVVTALRAYGVPLLAAMPYTGGRASDIKPTPELIAEAHSHRRVSVFALPGRDNDARLANLVHALNAGVPVAVGMKWPQYRTIRTGYLSEQQPLPGASHAVTIVGYENKTGRIADTVFIFKNSWSAHWGAAGYGYVTYGYLARNLDDTALLEVEPGAG
ncbi:MAG TPA: C1 family peptidase [Lacipirellulaceae bacterium]|nr:C1 family peptidase [Lacipirellulaceae bacterium]